MGDVSDALGVGDHDGEEGVVGEGGEDVGNRDRTDAHDVAHLTRLGVTTTHRLPVDAHDHLGPCAARTFARSTGRTSTG
jgi:hypothetical protein